MQPVNHPAINSCCATDASRSVLKGFESSIMNIYASERLSPKMKKVRDDPSCAVCMEVFAGEDILYILPCQHYFHESCTQGWLADHSSCPMCKSSVCITPEK